MYHARENAFLLNGEYYSLTRGLLMGAPTSIPIPPHEIVPPFRGLPEASRSAGGASPVVNQPSVFFFLQRLVI